MLLCLVAVTVLCFGIIGGSILARHFAKQPLDRMRFHGFCKFPYVADDIDTQALIDMNRVFRTEAEQEQQERNTMIASILSNFFDMNNGNQDNFSDENFSDEKNSDAADSTTTNDLPDRTPPRAKDSQFFTEELEVNGGVAKIDVPDFRDGRNGGRFMHDFGFNQSGIVDQGNKRCFVLPLDRETVLPPTSFIELVRKMWDGYYDLDMTAVKKNMRVVVPAISDMSAVSPRIATECENMRIYRLEPIVHGVFKRSVEALSNDSKFAHFSGKLVEFNIHNIEEVLDAEK